MTGGQSSGAGDAADHPPRHEGGGAREHNLKNAYVDYPPRRADGVRRRVGIGHVVARVRHAARRGAAALPGVGGAVRAAAASPPFSGSAITHRIDGYVLTRRSFISALRIPAVLGAVLTVSGFTAAAGPPPLAALRDPVVWVVYALVAAAGAFVAISVVLAWRTARSSPAWLTATLVGMILVSLPPVSSFYRERHETQRFLSTAASTEGVVVNKYVRGSVRLVVEYKVGDQRYRFTASGQNPYVGTQAFRQWSRGDRIPVYYQPMAPGAPLVGDPDPEPRLLFEGLVKRWALWGLMLTAYLPLIVRGLRRGFVRPRSGSYEGSSLPGS